MIDYKNSSVKSELSIADLSKIILSTIGILVFIVLVIEFACI